jgi:hypothetical protein
MQQQQPFEDLYAPPVFGTSAVGTFGKTNSISLDDVFQDAFFSEDGELLDIGPADEAQPPPTQPYVQQQQEQPYQSMPIGLGTTAVGSNLLQQQQQQQQKLQTAPSALTSSLYARPPAAAPTPQRIAPQQYHSMGVTAAAAAGLLTEEQKLERRERNREHAKVYTHIYSNHSSCAIVALRQTSEPLV